jgi:hypothetical protein
LLWRGVRWFAWLNIGWTSTDYVTQMQDLYGAAGYFSEVKGSLKRKRSCVPFLSHCVVCLDHYILFGQFRLSWKGLCPCSCREEEKLTEVTVADKLETFRAKQEVPIFAYHLTWQLHDFGHNLTFFIVRNFCIIHPTLVSTNQFLIVLYTNIGSLTPVKCLPFVHRASVVQISIKSQVLSAACTV